MRSLMLGIGCCFARLLDVHAKYLKLQHKLGIYKALRTLYPTAERANHRIRLPTDDSPFNGQSALEYMSEGSLEHLGQARRYFEALKAP
jgi:hypothetical protein